MALETFPYFQEDIFLQYRPFPATPDSLWAQHWHETVVSFLFYLGIQLSSAPLMKRWLGRSYTELSKKTRVNFDIHVVSMVQCVLSVAILVPMWNHPLWANRGDDPYGSVMGYYPYGGFVAAVTVGYFVWDLVVCLRYFSLFGVGFLFHAFAAMFVFGSCFSPFCIPWIPAFLLFELSTPFVNLNWFASRLPAGTFGNKTVIVNGVFLLATFFCVRIVWGFYAVGLVAYDMFRIRHLLPTFLPISVLSLNVLLDVLNVYWFNKMILIARKKASGKQSSTAAVKEASKSE